MKDWQFWLCVIVGGVIVLSVTSFIVGCGFRLGRLFVEAYLR